ncbi:Nif3-like dinuclear metal center hexameric protein [Candidatus Annandia pinicola]|uniref:Nif3-like dinuclear metal center hexameric protein n=1 Tax=Candidatus Annandia pinicola TaxID=1345117 RepID=UPI001D025C6E|nr:Nif3-like dinuclear metal center hexameric protein [Candidatus Annandia pinicola]UDG80420.1 GTP cyclohydrolase 1 type 2 [Candidatus Annandia pinicola]
MHNILLEQIINKKLNNKIYKDCAFNGLQIKGKKKIYKIITAVSICKLIINIAIKKKADAIIVHHGIFWNNKKNNEINNDYLKLLLKNNINLYSWHIPLDINPFIGNNVKLAECLSIKIYGLISPLLFWGKLKKNISGYNFKKKIINKLKKKPLYYNNNAPYYIDNIAWCTGKGQYLIKKAINFGIDAFITGESSEDTIYIAKENKIHFFAAGHYNTEKSGIKYLGYWLKKRYNLIVNFINIYNPI